MDLRRTLGTRSLIPSPRQRALLRELNHERLRPIRHERLVLDVLVSCEEFHCFSGLSKLGSAKEVAGIFLILKDVDHAHSLGMVHMGRKRRTSIGPLL